MLRLTVDFADFPDSVRTLLGHSQAWVASHGSGSLVSSGDPTRQTIIEAVAMVRPEQAREVLEAATMLVKWGRWSLSGDPSEAAGTPFFVAAVSYRSREEHSGVWVNAYQNEPTPQQVLRNLFDEFVDNGEVDDDEVTFDAFVRAAKPHVVIVRPEELASFLEPNL